MALPDHEVLVKVARVLGGEDAIKIVETLEKVDEITDEEIVAKTDIKLNTVRKILYKLYDHSLVGLRRTRDDKTGWFIFHWRLQPDQIEGFLINQKKRILEKDNTLLFWGRISPYKGIEYLVSAVPIVKKHIPDLKVIIAGNGKFYFDVERIRNDDTYEIINRYVPNEELVELIQKSSLVICPYTDATQSGVIMTAYAFNKPVVASAVGGIPEVVEDGVTGRLVPPKNPQALATAIIDLLSNQQKREQMKKNIKKKCSEGRLSWDYIAKQTIEVYGKAIS